MNIAHLSTAKTWRGGEQQIAYLYKELHDHGVNQMIACVEGSAIERYAAEHRLNCATAFKGGGFSWQFAKQIAHVVKQQHIDLLHIHDSHAHNNALLARYAYDVKLPMVLSRRVDFPIGKNIFSRWKYNHESIKRIICVSNAIREVVTENIDDNGRLEVIYDGIDISKRHTNTGQLRREFEVPANTLMIGNVAALAPHKDHLTFLRTVKNLQGKINARFFLIGAGGEKDRIEAAIKQMGLEQVVTLTGFRKNAKDLLTELDALLITSETEGLGSTILDAFLSSVPVVATAAGGIPEIVKHEETGLLAAVRDDKVLAENILRLVNGNDLKRQIISNASQEVLKHSTTVMGERTLAIYKDILDRQ